MRGSLASLAVLVVGTVWLTACQGYNRSKLLDEVVAGLYEVCKSCDEVLPATQNATVEDLKVLMNYIEAERSYTRMQEYLDKIRSTVDDPNLTSDDSDSYALMLRAAAVLAYGSATAIPQDYGGPYADHVKDRAKFIADQAEHFRDITDDEVAEMRAAALKGLVREGKIQLGMTKEMVRQAWGEPDRINRTVSTTGVREQWVYEGKKNVYLYFDDGVLTSFQD